MSDYRLECGGSYVVIPIRQNKALTAYDERINNPMHSA
jgi:hypothetical protein